MADCSVFETSWQEHEADLINIRHAVFVVGQNVPQQDEWDGLDEQARHLLVVQEGDICGCARILDEGNVLHLGRVAVLEQWRGQGLGKLLVATTINIAQAGEYKFLVLDAQCSALEFYANFGFQVEGDEFMDAGIWHRHMKLVL